MEKTIRIRKSVCIAAIAIVAAILAASLLIAGHDTRSFISVNEDTFITIDTGVASVFVSVEDRTDMLVMSHHARNLEIEEDGDSVRITGSGRGVIEISLPSWLRIDGMDISTSGGDIVIERLMADTLSAISESGSIMATGISSGDIRTESGSGSMILTDTVAEETALVTASGNIRAIGSMGDISASSGSGSVYIVPVSEGTIHTSTDSGATTIIAGERSISWSTASGTVTVYGDEMPSSGGTDGAVVAASSVSGDIIIAK